MNWNLTAWAVGVICLIALAVHVWIETGKQIDNAPSPAQQAFDDAACTRSDHELSWALRKSGWPS